MLIKMQTWTQTLCWIQAYALHWQKQQLTPPQSLLSTIQEASSCLLAYSPISGWNLLSSTWSSALPWLVSFCSLSPIPSPRLREAFPDYLIYLSTTAGLCCKTMHSCVAHNANCNYFYLFFEFSLSPTRP